MTLCVSCGQKKTRSYVSGYRKFIFTNPSYFFSVRGVTLSLSLSPSLSLFVICFKIVQNNNESIHFYRHRSEISLRIELSFSFEFNWHGIPISSNENFSFGLKLIFPSNRSVCFACTNLLHLPDGHFYTLQMQYSIENAQMHCIQAYTIFGSLMFILHTSLFLSGILVANSNFLNFGTLSLFVLSRCVFPFFFSSIPSSTITYANLEDRKF